MITEIEKQVAEGKKVIQFDDLSLILWIIIFQHKV